MAAQPELVPGFSTAIDVEHSMEVVPLIQKPEEKYQSEYSTDLSVQVSQMISLKLLYCHITSNLISYFL